MQVFKSVLINPNFKFFTIGMNWKKIVGFSLVLVLFVSSAFVTPLGNDSIVDKENDPPFLQQPTNWADSVFETLSSDERIGQLFKFLI